MDYEKILKEALDNSSTPFEVQSWIEEQFPELRESEDERIRKKLIEAVKYDMVVGGTKDKQRAIAWLEKQGEQKPWSKEDEKNLLEISCLIGNYRTGDDEYKLDSWLNSLKNRVQPQKQEWSEEDTAMLNFITLILQRNKYDDYFTTFETSFEDCIRWFKSLKNRVQLKKEWSSGDEAHLHSLITHLEQWIERHPNTTGADIQGENIAWLKSLRPQK